MNTVFPQSYFDFRYTTDKFKSTSLDTLIENPNTGLHCELENGKRIIESSPTVEAPGCDDNARVPSIRTDFGSSFRKETRKLVLVFVFCNRIFHKLKRHIFN